MDIHTATRVTGGRRDGDRVIVEVEENGAPKMYEADHVLVSIGASRPCTA